MAAACRVRMLFDCADFLNQLPDIGPVFRCEWDFYRFGGGKSFHDLARNHVGSSGRSLQFDRKGALSVVDDPHEWCVVEFLFKEDAVSECLRRVTLERERLKLAVWNPGRGTRLEFEVVQMVIPNQEVSPSLKSKTLREERNLGHKDRRSRRAETRCLFS